MANNYILFSECLPVATDEQKIWLENWLKPYNEEMCGVKFSEWCKERGLSLNEKSVEWWGWPDFSYSFVGKEKELHTDGNEEPTSVQTAPWKMWIRMDESGNPGHVAVMVQAFFKKFKINSTFTLTWAETCSKPRVGKFSGGGFIVMPFGRSVRWTTPEMMFKKAIAQFEKKAKRKAADEKNKKKRQGKK